MDVAVVVNLIANDTDADSPTIFLLDVVHPSNGTVVNNEDSTVTYTPATSYTGVDSFDYLASDLDDVVSYWRLDGDGLDAVSSNHGTLNGGPGTVAGIYGDALAFDEVDDYVQTPDFAFTTNFTLSLGLRIDDNSGSLFQYIYSHGNINNPHSLNIFLNEDTHGTDPNKLRTVIRDTDDTLDNIALEFDASSIIGDGKWHTYTLTVESGVGSNVYLDGVLQNSDSRGGDAFDPVTDIFFGAREDLQALRLYGGSLDGIQLLDRALSAGEVSDLHTGGASLATAFVTIMPTYAISGTVFEDVNYGGGAGRDLAASSGITRSGAKVELYDAGAFADSTTTNGSGQYSFTVTDGSYTVRVVNETVTSSRTGYAPALLPVQTYRTNASTGTAVPVTDRVGGEIPHEVDSPVNVTDATLATLNAVAGEEVQSPAPVTVSGANVTGVDFGLNFSTIVSTNEAGPGSLRQFIVNANALDNIGLAQVGHAAGIETSIFEMPTTDPNYLAAPLTWTITPDSLYAFVSDPVVIDGYTQSGANPNTNAAPSALNGTLVVEIDDLSSVDFGLIVLNAAGGSTFRGLVMNHFQQAFALASPNSYVTGNYFGTDVTGLVDKGNTMAVSVQGNGITVGGAAAADRNLISANTHGVGISATSVNTVVQGNVIGVGSDATTDLGNTLSGILISGTPSGTLLGGTSPAAGNFITKNLIGVRIESSLSETSILGNSIFGNDNFGIDLGEDGVTSNDGDDADSGPNDLRNFPVITSATESGGTISVDFDLDLGATLAGDYRIEFFKNPNGVDATNGEGEVFASDTLISHTGSGVESFSHSFAGVTGDTLTATTTDSVDAGGYGGTSEFSAWFGVTVPPTYEISGTVFEDADFAGTASEFNGATPDSALPNVDVELYDASDSSYVTSATTGASGNYSFSSLADGDYFVRVRSFTIGLLTVAPTGGLNATVPVSWPYPLPEMTWGDGSALYGGQDPVADDTDTGDNLGLGDTHVAVTVSGADETNVNFGFAYNLIVNTNDDGLGNTLRSGQGSLRQFIKNANAIGTAGSTTANSSEFRVPTTDPGYNTTGNSEFTFGPVDELPEIDDSLTIDGYTQPGAGANTVPAPAASDAVLLIELDGTGAGGSAHALTISSGSCTVRGLVINRWDNDAIEVNPPGGANVFEGNYIGTNVTGTATSANNGAGIDVDTDGNFIGGTTPDARNLITGNDQGIALSGAGATGNFVRGNFIGLDVSGAVALGNSSDGIRINSGATGNTIGGSVVSARNVIAGNSDGIEIDAANGNTVGYNFIGTDVTGLLPRSNSDNGVEIVDANTNVVERNVISGNDGDGVMIDGAGAFGNIVRSNYIGVDYTGAAPLANGIGGCRVQGGASNNTIGGGTLAARNVLSGNGEDGIYVTDAGTDSTVIQGNYFGTNAAGTAAIPNGDRGVQIESGATNTIIGGTGTNDGNLISGNTGDGLIIADWLTLGTTGTIVEGNLIGVAIDGVTPLGNQKQGIQIAPSSGNRIGGTTPTSGNVIAHNNWSGIHASSNTATDNSILRNSIHSNGNQGIDLDGDGITSNDFADADAGANELRNFPVITSAIASGGTITVDFDLDLGATLAGDYRIEFFKNPSGLDATNGEGENFADAVVISHGGTGVEPFSHSFSGTASDTLTATTTDSVFGGGYGNTSEFSAWSAVTAASTISGTVFEDADFAGTATDFSGATPDSTLPDVDVELYDASDSSYISSTTTTFAGAYSFTSLIDGDYFVRVRAATIGDANTAPTGGLNGTVPGTWPYPLAEMTWGNGAAVYGGQSATADDSDVGNNAGIGDNHVPVTVSGADETGVNFGFAYNLIVNTEDDGLGESVRSDQGSLRQFIKNANAIGTAGSTTANYSEFYMQVPAVIVDGPNDWWRIEPVAALPALTDDATVIDGATQANNSGVDSNVNGPEIEIHGASAGLSNGLYLLGATNVVLRDLGINFFGLHGVSIDAATGASLFGNYIGIRPDRVTSLVNDKSGVSIAASGVTIGSTVAGEGNLIAYNWERGVQLQASGVNAEIIGNTIRDNGHNGIRSLATDLLIAKNLIRNNSSRELWDEILISGDTKVYNNTIHGSPSDGIAIEGINVDIKNNIVTGGAGFGINVVTGSITDSNNLITDAVTTPANGSGQSNVALSASTLNADPQYVNAAGDNFNLTECTSPAVNAGMDLAGDQPDMNGVTAGLFNGSKPEMGAFETTCLFVPVIVKKAFTESGVPIAPGTTLPAGTRVKYLLYVNNSSALILDANLQDVLNPGFSYVLESMTFDNTEGECTLPDCSTTEESAIYTAADGGTTGSDTEDTDEVNYDSGILNAGSGNASNAQLDLLANKVWAVVFTVRMN